METDKKIVPVTLPNDSIIYIEVDDEEGRQLVSSDNPDLLLTALKNQIIGVATFIKESLDQLSPTKVNAKFAIELAVSEGNLIGIFAKTSAKGNIEISLEWEKGMNSKKPPPSE